MIRKRDGKELTQIQITKENYEELKKRSQPKKLSAAAMLELILEGFFKK